MWSVYLLVCLLVFVVVVVGRLVIRAAWRGGPVGRSGLAVGIALCGWALYRAVVPSPASYVDEFTRLTGIVLPASSELLFRDASFPDRHGQYKACFLAKMPPGELPALQARLGAPVAFDRWASCGNAQPIQDGAIRYELRGKDASEQAAVTVTVYPDVGWLVAQWQVQRKLIAP